MQDSLKNLIEHLSERRMMIATAESCTGGLLAAALTHQAGSSRIFDCGFITYSNESKISALDVPAEIIARHGAVSSETALAMARGVLEKTRADLAISITGIAGPGGGTPEKPVGLVHFGFALRGKMTKSTEHHFTGARMSIRRKAVSFAIAQALSIIKETR